MGDILKFEPKRSGGGLRRRAGSGSAAIIIFSGVRYERLTGATAPARAGGKPKRPAAVSSPANQRLL